LKVQEILADGGYTNVKTLASQAYRQWDEPGEVAVDANDNVFFNNPTNGRVYELIAASGYTQVKTVDSDALLDSMTVDANGNVFEVDFLHVREILAADGYKTVKILFTGQFNHDSVQVDTSGNVYITDVYNHMLSEIFAAGGYTRSETLAPLTLEGQANAGLAWDGSVDSESYD
jgi:hypothetical protein